MANLKISQLTPYTGTAADQRVFVMNNIDETETFKFSGFTSPFRVGNSANSFVGLPLTADKVAGPNDFVQGPSNRIGATGGQSLVIGGEDNNITSAASGYNSIVGSFQSTVNADFGSGIYASRASSAGGFFSAIIGANAANLSGGRTSIIAGGENITLSNVYSSTLGGRFLTNSGFGASLIGGISNNISSTYGVIIGGDTNVNSTSPSSSIISSTGSTISGKNLSVMIGTSGRTASQNFATHVENLVVFNYDNLDFADDTAAAAGGVVLGQVYHNAGALRIRVV